jgi:uncharacterized damage-inducible protein DinB
MNARAATTMALYNRWMNERLYEHCARLSDEERKRDVGAYFKSIHGTLNHLLLGDRIWLGRFTGKPYAVGSLAQELYPDFGELRAERRKMDAAIVEWTASLTDARFDGDLSYTSVVNPQPRSYPFWFAASQFFNHQTHHRGQLTTLLSQRGIDPGVTDLIWLPEFQKPA